MGVKGKLYVRADSTVLGMKMTYECLRSGRDRVDDDDAIWTSVTGSLEEGSSWWVGIEKRSQKPGSWMAIVWVQSSTRLDMIVMWSCIECPV